MNSEGENIGESETLSTKLIVGRFIRRQGQYGSIAAVGRVVGDSVELFDDPKKAFPRDGLVETHGIGHHASLNPGDWVEFDVVKNSRPRAPFFKVSHLYRVPRYKDLQDVTFARIRTLLTKEGWRGDARPGLWAFRVSDDKVLVTDMELRGDGALRIPRKFVAELRWYNYEPKRVLHLLQGKHGEDVFLSDTDHTAGVLNWSDEADHVARVIRSLADANDPFLTELISWLELHQEAATGRVVAATLDHDAAEAALRSGELAQRLRADRDLMKAYLDAALLDDEVRKAFELYAREGLGAEADQKRKELATQIAEERKRLIAELETEIASKIVTAVELIDRDAIAIAEERRKERERLEQIEDEKFKAKLVEMEKMEAVRRETLAQEQKIQQARLFDTMAETDEQKRQLERANAERQDAESRLKDSKSEIDRLLSIAARLGSASLSPMDHREPLLMHGVNWCFSDLPKIPAKDKAKSIERQALLNERGKELLRSLFILLLSGELPVLVQSDVNDFLHMAEALVGPGRMAIIEADPTMISIDDLWSRPGSGAPTAMALAADAAKEVPVLVVLRGIERSGARFWYPALTKSLRTGALPRGLLVCCTVDNLEHEEVEALPKDLSLLEVSEVFEKGSFLGAPFILTPPQLELSSFDPGLMPIDLSGVTPILATIGFTPTISQALRIARIYSEAIQLIENEESARLLVTQTVQSWTQRRRV